MNNFGNENFEVSLKNKLDHFLRVMATVTAQIQIQVNNFSRWFHWLHKRAINEIIEPKKEIKNFREMILS